jgi:hypothetical protein
VYPFEAEEWVGGLGIKYMNDYIPFVQTEKDCVILNSLYADAAAVRLSVYSSEKTMPKLPNGVLRWLDAGIDAIEQGSSLTDDYRQYLQQFTAASDLLDPTFQKKPVKATVASFVKSVLDKCKSLNPDWISVPQLPQVNGAERNKLNRQLAEYASIWRNEADFQGKLVLPLIFTHQKQIYLKTDRNKKIAVAKECYHSAGAEGIWVVESSLSDQDGSNTFDTARFPALIHLHEELRDAIQSPLTIAGPYWGMNIVLWARGLATNPAIGLGNSYQYHVPGSVIKGGKTRVALPPLRRWAVVSVQLKHWLEKALQKIPTGDPAQTQLAQVLKNWDKLSIQSRTQVATFYKQWLSAIAQVSPAGRSLALYQDLSSAYVVGKTLDKLPPDEGAGRRPEKVAQQFMMRCL